MQRVRKWVLSWLGEFTAQSLANAVWAFAKLETTDAALMEGLRTRADLLPAEAVIISTSVPLMCTGYAHGNHIPEAGWEILSCENSLQMSWGRGNAYIQRKLVTASDALVDQILHSESSQSDEPESSDVSCSTTHNIIYSGHRGSFIGRLG